MQILGECQVVKTFNLGKNIKEMRKVKGVTQIQLAEFLKVSNATIAYWETNRHQPDLETIKKIAKFFDVTVDSLLDND